MDRNAKRDNYGRLADDDEVSRNFRYHNHYHYPFFL